MSLRLYLLFIEIIYNTIYYNNNQFKLRKSHRFVEHDYAWFEKQFIKLRLKFAESEGRREGFPPLAYGETSLTNQSTSYHKAVHLLQSTSSPQYHLRNPSDKNNIHTQRLYELHTETHITNANLRFQIQIKIHCSGIQIKHV